MANICSEKSAIIVRFLGRRYNDSFYVREIAKELNLSLGPVSETLKELEKAGLLIRKERGRIVTYRANMESPVLREMKVFITLLECAGFLKELEKAALRVVLFGSCARGDDTSESDIDILIDTDDKETVESVVNLNEYIGGRKLSAIVLSPGEFRALREKDRPFYERVMQGKELFRRNEDETEV
ncbi:ArsR family transcriptional regulator [Methanolacinia paynteri]|uniref:ArsR family transcriptional regulator n=1 Tax=Methanolacinia paynteri TaxID=230356 RepID=UPI00064FD6A0|nr:ArsR family transcriptional regulator [Methanolacinia paynteri]